MTDVNGLGVTPVRVRLLGAIQQDSSRVYYEPGDKEIYDSVTAYKVTDRVRQMVAAQWLYAEKVNEASKRAGEIVGRSYFRLTDVGRAVLEGHRR